MSIATIIKRHKVGFTNQQIADQMLAVHQDMKRARDRGDEKEWARLDREMKLLGEQMQDNIPS